MSGTESFTPRDDYSDLVGYRFPGGTYRLAWYEAWLWADAVAAEPNDGLAHPGIAYMIGLHGGGASIQDIMDVLGTSNDAGVMMAGVEFDLNGTIEPGTAYQVDGEITSVTRKSGRRTGPFDLVGFEHRLTALSADGMSNSDGPVAVVRHSWLVPRPDGGVL